MESLIVPYTGRFLVVGIGYIFSKPQTSHKLMRIFVLDGNHEIPIPHLE